MATHGRVLTGPDFLIPVPDESLGTYLHQTLMKYSNGDIMV